MQIEHAPALIIVPINSIIEVYKTRICPNRQQKGFRSFCYEKTFKIEEQIILGNKAILITLLVGILLILVPGVSAFGLDINIGDTVRVIANLNVRTGPGTGYPEITDPDYSGYASVGTVGEVLDGPVSANGYYWWKVDFGPGLYTGWSVQDGLEKVQTVPEPPMPTSPGSSSEPGPVIATLTPTLQWNGVSDADYYAIAISQYPYGSGNIVYNPQQLYGTSHTVPAGKLEYGKKYRWNMQAHNSAGWSAVSSRLYFQTYTPDVTLTLYVHEGSASGPIIAGARVTGQDAVGNSFDKTTNSSGYVMITGAPSGNDWQFTASKSGYETVSWSQDIMATYTRHAYLIKVAQKPDPPTLLSPGSTSEPGPVIATLTLTLQWTGVSNADYYALAISKYPYGSGNIVYNPQQLYGTLHPVPSGVLEHGKKYRWNMQAHNSAGWSDVSSTLYFQMSHLPVEIYVPDDYSTIQAAIDAAFDGDTVIVRDGTYTGTGNRDIDFKGKAINLRSENGPESCIIDCEGTESEPHRGFYFHRGEGANSVLQGLTITNGYAAAYMGDMGGGIYCYDSSPTISNCTIRDNTSSFSGGGICCYDSSSTVANCVIANNIASSGGGLNCYESALTISNCIFTENVSEYVGAGIDCSFANNVVVEDCHFIRNSAGSSGGGINLSGEGTISGCTFTKNSAGDGGGLFCEYCNSTKICSCAFVGNEVAYHGGGVRLYCAGNTILSNCTFNGNKADGYGGGIYCSWSTPVIRNSILWYNTAGTGSEIALLWGDVYWDPTIVTLSYTNMQGGQANAYVDPESTLVWGNGNISCEPKFMSDGYHLTSASPCINAGSTELDYTGQTDIDGEPRVINGRVDMGADEYSGTVCQCDNYADLGDPEDEVSHNLVGWDEVGSWGTSPSGDTTARCMRLGENNYLDLCVSETDKYYLLTAEVLDGTCEDNFEIYVNGNGPLYSYVSDPYDSMTIETHQVIIPSEYITDTRVRINFKNTSNDLGCSSAAFYYGRASVYNVKLTPPGYAVIVAGDTAWWDWSQKKAINHSANNAYRVLRNLGLNDDHIFYLNTEPQFIGEQDVVDMEPSLNNLKNSLSRIQSMIGDCETPLILYLVGHGIKDVFDFYTESDALSSTDLREMLGPFSNTRMLIVVGSCYSGSFITIDGVNDSISADNRIIITACHDDEERYSMLGLGGWYHSSDRFWGKLNDGLNVRDAFITDAWPGERKHLWLDDNGDSKGHSPHDLEDDGRLAAGTHIGVPGTQNLELVPWYLVWKHSPGELRVYDSQNRVTGLINGEIREEIPGSIYDEQNEIVALFGPYDVYRYEVLNTGEGAYGLDIGYIKGGEIEVFTATDIPTSPNAVHQYTIDWDALSVGEEGVTLNIDNDGDGIFEQTVTADNDLTYDEFVLQTETVVDFDPDTLNLKSKGKFVTVYIELPEGFDVSEIDISRLTLNESVPALPKPIEIGDHDSDGIADLMVKFDRQQLIGLLEAGEQVIALTGQLTDGTPLAGIDTIRVIH